MKLLEFNSLLPFCCSSKSEHETLVQYFESEDLTMVPKTNAVAVTNDFHIFKFWQESHGRKDSSFFIYENKSNKLIRIGDQPTNKKMQATGYKSAGAALQALCA